MMGTLSIGAVAGGAPNRGRSIATGTDIEGGGLKVQLQRIPSAAMDSLSLSDLNVDNQSVLDQIEDPESPQLASNPTPGRVSGSGAIVSGLIAPLEIGALYVISYEIAEDHGTTSLHFPDGAGSPFANSNVAAFTPGRHKILVEAKDSDTAAILRVTGDLTFKYISCRKAEWRLALPSGDAHPELAARREPGRLRGTGVAVSSLIQPLEVGAAYTLRYEILADNGTEGFFTSAGAGSPFVFTQLPTNVGHHAITLIAQDSDTDAIARLTGDLTFGHFSCRKAGGSAGRQIAMDVSVGSTRTRNTVYTPDPGDLYVAPNGDDARGTGAFGSPFRTPDAACRAARPGDTIFLRPGTYRPFEVTLSGTAGNPVTITTLPGEERLAVIEGDLAKHVVYGGEGVAADEATRDGIYILARDHIHIRNLTIRNCWRAGIFVVGKQGEQHGHHVIADNAISMTGSSGIYVGGNSSTTIIPLTETGALRTTDVLIEGNDVSRTNVVTDYNNNTTNPQGEPGGVAEAITVAASAQNIVTRFNDVHDTRQYGIDYKAGVRGGAIYGNRVWNVERYGIYCDTGRRFVENVAIYNNRVWSCRIGIVLSREAGSNTVAYDTFKTRTGAAEFVQSLADIDIYNNVVWNIETAGIFCQRHNQKDGPDGRIRNIRIRFNTVYNANRSGSGRDLNLSGWSDPDFAAAGIVSGVDFSGNIVWNDTGPISVLNTFAGKPGFTQTGNLIGTDPGFVSPRATVPDLSLRSTSAARGLVTAAHVTGNFGQDIDGRDRSLVRSAGALAAPAS